MRESKEVDESTVDISFNWLCRRSTWVAKVDILATTSIPDGQLNAAVNDLIARGVVGRLRQGERRSAMCRVVVGVR